MDIFFYLGQRSVSAADGFLHAAQQTFDRLARTPGMSATLLTDNPRLSGLRAARVGRFRNYVVFYRADDQTVEIMRVLHGAQDLESILGADTGETET